MSSALKITEMFFSIDFTNLKLNKKFEIMVLLIIIEIKEKVYCFPHLYYDNNDVIFVCFPYPLNNNWLQ